MSHLFDALVKSEAERSGKGILESSECLELLRNAERRASLRWQPSPDVSSSEQPRPDEVVPIRAALAAGTRFENGDTLQISPGEESRLAALTLSDSPAAEAFRILSVRLRHLQRERAIKSLLISSTIPQEGKSLVAGNLACTLGAKGEQKVLLIEGDLRRPSLMKLFGLTRSAGITDALQDGRALADRVHYLDGAGVWILPAGREFKDVSALLQLDKVQSLLEQSNGCFDWIIIDSPPILPLADASVWMRLADAILLVVRQGVTQRRELQKGLEALDDQKLIGAVLNCARNPAYSDYYY